MIEDFIRVNDTRHPVQIHIEKRRSSRASIGKKAVYIRLPSHLPLSLRHAQIERFKKWALEKIAEGGIPATPVRTREYENGERIVIAGVPFTLVVRTPKRTVAQNRTPRTKARESGRIVGREIRISCDMAFDRNRVQKRMSRLIAHSVGRHMLPVFETRIAELNRIHFGFRYERIRLKNMSSRWGSCSSKGNLNFALRLCLTPPEVIDYVIIHELAHIKQRNHSQSFWKLVGRAMPSWKEKRRWLRMNRESCVF